MSWNIKFLATLHTLGTNYATFSRSTSSWSYFRLHQCLIGLKLIITCSKKTQQHKHKCCLMLSLEFVCSARSTASARYHRGHSTEPNYKYAFGFPQVLEDFEEWLSSLLAVPHPVLEPSILYGLQCKCWNSGYSFYIDQDLTVPSKDRMENTKEADF